MIPYVFITAYTVVLILYIQTSKDVTRNTITGLEKSIAASEKSTRETITALEKSTRDTITASEKSTRDTITASEKSTREIIAANKNISDIQINGVQDASNKQIKHFEDKIDAFKDKFDKSLIFSMIAFGLATMVTTK